MIALLWLASWITLFCVGHPFAATVDLCVGAAVWLLTFIGLAAVATSLIKKAL